MPAILGYKHPTVCWHLAFQTVTIIRTSRNSKSFRNNHLGEFAGIRSANFAGCAREWRECAKNCRQLPDHTTALTRPPCPESDGFHVVDKAAWPKCEIGDTRFYVARLDSLQFRAIVCAFHFPTPFRPPARRVTLQERGFSGLLTWVGWGSAGRPLWPLLRSV
jgi:hypothetical protein